MLKQLLNEKVIPTLLWHLFKHRLNVIDVRWMLKQLGHLSICIFNGIRHQPILATWVSNQDFLDCLDVSSTRSCLFSYYEEVGFSWLLVDSLLQNWTKILSSHQVISIPVALARNRIFIYKWLLWILNLRVSTSDRYQFYLLNLTNEGNIFFTCNKKKDTIFYSNYLLKIVQYDEID